MSTATTPAPAAARPVTTDNVGFLLAKASQRWNELLYAQFVARGYSEVRPSYGSLLLPLFEEDGLRMGQLAERARLSKQTMTTLVRLCERAGMVKRGPDPADARATIVSLTSKAERFRDVAEIVLTDLEGDAAAALGPRRLDNLRKSLEELG